MWDKTIPVGGALAGGYSNVDGDHSFQHAYADINSYSKFLSNEFVFGGHDIVQDRVAKAPCKLIREGRINSISFRDPDWIVTSVS